jgi:hypothetical protein
MRKTTQRDVEKEDKAKFNNAWFAAVVKVTGERFHNNFKVGFKAHPLGYKGFGLGVSFQ